MKTEGNAGRDGERVVWFVVFGLQHWQRKQNLVVGDKGLLLWDLGGTGTRSCVPEVFWSPYRRGDVEGRESTSWCSVLIRIVVTFGPISQALVSRYLITCSKSSLDTVRSIVRRIMCHRSSRTSRVTPSDPTGCTTMSVRG